MHHIKAGCNKSGQALNDVRHRGDSSAVVACWKRHVQQQQQHH